MKSGLRRKVPPIKIPPGASWAVIPIDGAPLRKKAQRAYQKALRDLDAAKAVIEHFQNHDQPLYSRWVNQNFGVLLTNIRELQSRLMELQMLIDEVEEEYFFGGHRSHAAAYREVMRRRAEPEAPENPASPDPSDSAPHDAEEEFRRQFEEAFAKGAEEFWERLGGKAVRPRREREKPKKDGRLKDLYRTLARRLHPDTSRDLNPSEKEWWHQTQAAYESGNIEQMEMIFTLVEIQDKGTRESSISSLAKLTAGFKKRLRTLKRQLTELRQEAAWNFSNRTDLAALSVGVRRSLERERNAIRLQLGELEVVIQHWEKTPARARKHVTQRREWVDEEWF